MAEKNMIEDTLVQIKNLEESLKKNAQGILSSTMRKEINSLVKESLMEQEEITTPAPEDVDAETPMLPDEEEGMDFAEPEMDAEEPMMMGDEMTGMEPEEDETIDMRGASDSEVIRVFKAMGDNDGVVVTRDNNIITLTDDDDEYIIKLNESMENNSMEKDLEEMFGSHEDYSFEDEEEEDEDMEDFSFDDEEEDEDEMDMDMQEMYMDDMSSYDDEDEDEMEDFSFDDEEEEDEMEDFSFDDEEEDEDEMEEGIVYEIEMDDMKMSMDEEDDFMSLDSEYGEDEMYSYDDEEDDENLSEAKSMRQKSKGVGMGKGPKFKYGQVTDYKTTKQKEGTKGVGMGKAKFTYKDGENLDGEFRPIKSGKKVETKEASRTYGSGKSFGRGLPKPKTAPRHLKEEVIELRTKNGEYRKALDLFRTKLNEVAVFNSNLAYATRLFTEHSTTKQEKINILRRFDDVETLKESKNLYRVVKSELSNNSLSENVSITESLERTVNKTSTSGSAVNLIESKTYENPQFLRMKDLMTKL
jgi:hypothetical protein